MSKTAEYKKELLKVIKGKEIARLNHCFGFTTFSRPTAFNHKLNEDEEIKRELDKNRVMHKHHMLYKWIKSDNATLQIAAMRLLADKEEHQKLNQHYVDHTSDGDKISTIPTTIEYQVVPPESE